MLPCQIRAKERKAILLSYLRDKQCCQLRNSTGTWVIDVPRLNSQTLSSHQVAAAAALMRVPSATSWLLLQSVRVAAATTPA
jgi:hypothetical protein